MERIKKLIQRVLDLLMIVLAVISVAVIILAVTALYAEAAEIPNITEPCGLTSEQLEKGLKKELSGYADIFLEAEENYQINAVFLAAVAAHESGWGTSRLAENKNNLFGWQGDDGFKKFDSFEHSVDFVAWRLYKNYIMQGKDTISKIGKIYCPDEGQWEKAIIGIYNDIMEG